MYPVYSWNRSPGQFIPKMAPYASVTWLQHVDVNVIKPDIVTRCHYNMTGWCVTSGVDSTVLQWRLRCHKKTQYKCTHLVTNRHHKVPVNNAGTEHMHLIANYLLH